MLLPLNRFSSRGGCLVRLLLGFGVFGALVALAWMLFLPLVLTQVIRSRTGFEVSVEQFSVNPFGASARCKGLVLSNPEGFEVHDFVKLRTFSVDVDLPTLFSEQWVVDEATLDIEAVTLVKGKTGESNASLLQKRLKGGEAVEQTPKAVEQERTLSKPERKFLIRRLHLRMERLVLVDARGEKPSTRTLDVALDQNFENVTSATQVAVPIVGKVLALGGALGDYAGQFGTQALEAAKKAGSTLKETGKKAGEALKGLLDNLGGKK